jgi:hypothetical protein
MNTFSIKPFSKTGIFSFIFGILGIIASCLLILFLIVGGEWLIKAAFASFWVAIGSSIIAFVLGIAVFFQKKRKRIFGFVGFLIGLGEIILIGFSISLLLKFTEYLGKILGSGFGKM